MNGCEAVRHYDGYRLGIQSERPVIMSGESWRHGSIVIEADSLGSTFTAVQQHFPHPSGAEVSCELGASDFHVFPSWDQAWRTFTKDPSSLRTFTENDTLLRSISQAGNEVGWNVTGDFLDIGRYLEGAPECFGQMQMGKVQGFATVFVNMCVHGAVPHHTIQQFSKRIIRLVDWLEANLIRTRVVGFRSNETMHYECTVKRHDDHLDLNDIAVLSNPDFHRRILFRITEHSDTHHGYRYGSATSVRSRDFTAEPLGRILPDELVIVTEKIATRHAEGVDAVYDKLEQDISEHIREGFTTGVISVNL